MSQCCIECIGWVVCQQVVEIEWFFCFWFGIGQFFVVKWLDVDDCVYYIMVNVQVVDMGGIGDLCNGFINMGMYVQCQFVVGSVNLFDKFCQLVMVIMYDMQYGFEDFFFQFCEVFQFNKCGYNKCIGLLFLSVIVVFMCGLENWVVFGVYCLDMMFDVGFGFVINYWFDIGCQMVWIFYLIFCYCVV